MLCTGSFESSGPWFVVVLVIVVHLALSYPPVPTKAVTHDMIHLMEVLPFCQLPGYSRVTRLANTRNGYE